MKHKTYYSNQTRASLSLFDKVNGVVSLELIKTIAQIKIAAAWANYKAGKIDKYQYLIIKSVSNKILKGKHYDQFVTSALQGGAGTSINTNVNEVISGIAKHIHKINIHPNDHINASQSTNDVVPSALRILSIIKTNEILLQLSKLTGSLLALSKKHKNTVKLSRTHYQDAVPVTYQRIFSSYCEILKRDEIRIRSSLSKLFELNLGGTAIGTSTNTNIVYLNEVYKKLKVLTGFKLRKAKNLMSLTSSSSDFLELSCHITILHNDLSKISNDIRFLASGPKGGVGEIKLPEYLDGSTIMPGKVNPVVPEFMNQIYYYIAGKNLTIQLASEASSQELSIMLPVISDSLISMLDKSAKSIMIFNEKCIRVLEIDRKRTRQLLENSYAYATLLTPHLGYDTVKKLVHEAMKKNTTLRNIVIKKGLLTNEKLNNILK